MHMNQMSEVEVIKLAEANGALPWQTLEDDERVWWSASHEACDWNKTKYEAAIEFNLVKNLTD